VSEAVLHGDAFADTCATVAGLGQSTEALLEKLAVGDRHRTAIAGRGGRALITQFAAIAGIRIELDIGAEIDRLDLASWTRDGAVAQVDQEVSLAVRVSRRRSICSRLE
jgi:hypothetical protein